MILYCMKCNQLLYEIQIDLFCLRIRLKSQKWDANSSLEATGKWTGTKRASTRLLSSWQLAHSIQIQVTILIASYNFLFEFKALPHTCILKLGPSEYSCKFNSILFLFLQRWLLVFLPVILTTFDQSCPKQSEWRLRTVTKPTKEHLQVD